MRLLFDSKYFRFAVDLGKEDEPETVAIVEASDFGLAPSYDQNENRYEEDYENFHFGFREL